MRLDGLEELEDEQRVRELIRQRQNYLKSESAQVYQTLLLVIIFN